MSTLAERFRAELTRTGISQVELSRYMGCTQGNVSHILSGRNKEISAELAVKAAKAFGVSAQWLASGEHAREHLPAAAMQPTPVNSAHPKSYSAAVEALTRSLDLERQARVFEFAQMLQAEEMKELFGTTPSAANPFPLASIRQKEVA